MAEDNVVVEQIDRDAYAAEVERLGDKESADRIRAGKRDTLTILRMLARHRLAAQAHEPSADVVERVARALAKVDRIEICSDASYRHSSYGIRATAAIAAMRPESERAGIVAYLRGLPDAFDFRAAWLADAIERGDHLKEPSHD